MLHMFLTSFSISLLLCAVQVEPNAHRIEEHRRKYERLRKEKEDKKIERERQRRRAQAQVVIFVLIS